MEFRIKFFQHFSFLIFTYDSPIVNGEGCKSIQGKSLFLSHWQLPNAPGQINIQIMVIAGE